MRVLALVLVVLLFAACKDSKPPPPESLTLEALRNATYQTGDKSIELVNGSYLDRASTSLDSRGDVNYRLNEDVMGRGDVDRDGSGDTVVILVAHVGAGAQLPQITVLLNKDGQPQSGGSVLLHDRTYVRNISVEDGVILAEVTTHAATDPLCCPSVEGTRRYRFSTSGLAEEGAP